jgi:hypothetical protein
MLRFIRWTTVPWSSRRRRARARLESGPTLKAFANSSPGLRSGNPGLTSVSKLFATLKGLRTGCDLEDADATLSGLRTKSMSGFVPGLPRCNPGLKLANAFSVIKTQHS